MSDAGCRDLRLAQEILEMIFFPTDRVKHEIHTIFQVLGGSYLGIFHVITSLQCYFSLFLLFYSFSLSFELISLFLFPTSLQCQSPQELITLDEVKNLRKLSTAREATKQLADQVEAINA